MDPLAPQHRELLAAARQRTEGLLDDLLRQREQLQQSGAQAFADGTEAYNAAIAAAQRLLRDIDKAIASAGTLA